MNSLHELSLAEFAWEKVRFTKRLLKRHEPRAALPVAWYHGLMHLNPTEHIPESVREDFQALSMFMRTELAGGPCFGEAVSDFDIEQALFAFLRFYDAVERWYIRLNAQVNQEESPKQ